LPLRPHYSTPQKNDCSRTIGRIADAKILWVKNTFINQLSKKYQVDMFEQLISDLCLTATLTTSLPSHSFRALRPICEQKTDCLARDGQSAKLGEIEHGTFITSQSQPYQPDQGPLSGDASLSNNSLEALSQPFTLSKRLPPCTMPLPAQMTKMIPLPGKLFSVTK